MFEHMSSVGPGSSYCSDLPQTPQDLGHSLSMKFALSP